MNEKNNSRGIFYGVIGVATLVIAIIGATFAYFTATATAGNNVITGNMATINFGLKVEKVSTADEQKGGMIPMSNNMVERAFDSGTDGAVTLKTGDDICTDDNKNAVCQVYKITVENTGSASLFLDGYVTLSDDISVVYNPETGEATETKVTVPDYDGKDNNKNFTSMRWAQVFCTETAEGTLNTCTTVGKTTTRASVNTTLTDYAGKGISSNWDAVLNTNTADDNQYRTNQAQIARADATTYVGSLADGRIVSVAKNGAIAGNYYDIIDSNFIRLSNHDVESTSYDREDDVTSALVYNQPLDAKNATADNNGDSNDSDSATDGSQAYTDAQVYYIVVWLTETGVDQTQAAGSETNNKAGDGYHFFSGSTTFVSAQGSEVTATFSGYSRVPNQNLTQAS